MKKLSLICLLVIVVLAFNGCSFICYARFGPQKLKKVQVTLEGQEADPNIPKGLIDVGILKL